MLACRVPATQPRRVCGGGGGRLHALVGGGQVLRKQLLPARSRGRMTPIAFRGEEEQPVDKSVERKLAHTTSKVTHSMTGWLSSPGSQALAYWALGGVALGTAVGALAVPERFAAAMFAGAAPDRITQSVVRAAGATLLTTATVKFTLKEASARGQLYMETFKRLNLGLMAQTACCLVILAQGVSVRTPALTAFLGSVCGVGLLLAWRVFAINKAGIRGTLPLPSPAKTLSAALSVLMPRNGPAAVYSLLTMGLAGMALMCLRASPGQPLPLHPGFHGPVTVFMQRVTGAGLLLLTVVAYCLKDGADRGRLAAESFRWLNLGLASSLLAFFAYLAVDVQAGHLAANARTSALLAAQLAGFAWTAAQYAGATK